MEGKGYVTPRQRSLEPETSSATRLTRTPKPRRIRYFFIYLPISFSHHENKNNHQNLTLEVLFEKDLNKTISIQSNHNFRKSIAFCDPYYV